MLFCRRRMSGDMGGLGFILVSMVACAAVVLASLIIVVAIWLRFRQGSA
jgi:uncharacterized membrane protein